jgi:UDP-N-acetylmuramoyl-tripeptide--D-alanyl-D-alanine ligase
VSVSLIEVPDTLLALQAIGREVRRQSGARVVAITGSAGKTTTKEITATLLSARYRVFRNHGNFNNHIGLPLSLVELRHGPEIAVVELGMNHVGEIRMLVGIAEPDVRVWTNVGDAHVGHFGSREAIARAKAEVLEGATPDTLLVANADDPLVMAHLPGFPGRVVTFGERAGASVRASNVVDLGVDGTTADVETPAGRIHLTVPLAGRAQLQNVLAAVAVALEFGVPVPAIESRTAVLRPVARRGAVTTLANGARLIDDSYNASPAAVEVMLAALAATRTRGRRVAVLGEMLELGESARALHDACGRAVARAGVDELVVVGGSAADGLVEGATAAGLAPGRIHRYSDSVAAADPVARLVGPGDLVLVKGSRGTRTDVIADRLSRAAEVA